MGTPYGLQAMLKEGHKHFSGLEEAVLRNIDACKALSQITRTSMGPNGARAAPMGARRARSPPLTAPLPRRDEQDGDQPP
jgi:hypothetical protein